MNQKVMEVKKAYMLTKTVILQDPESNFVPSWDDVSSNHEKAYFLRKVFFNIKSDKISFKESYKITKEEVDWKAPSITEIKKYVIEHIKIEKIHKHFGYIIHETTFEDNTLMAKNNELIDKSIKSPKSNNIASTTTSTSPFISLTKISRAILNKCIKSPELTPIKQYD